MNQENLINGIVVIIFALLVMTVPYCCCQVSNEDYKRIVEGVKLKKMEMIEKERQKTK
jgi:hypothetical protein